MVKSNNRKNAYQEAYTILQELDEEEYLKVLDELESKVNALIIAGLQTRYRAKISANATRNKSNNIQHI